MPLRMRSGGRAGGEAEWWPGHATTLLRGLLVVVVLPLDPGE